MCKRFIFTILVAIMMAQLSFTAIGQSNGDRSKREQWFKEMKAKKQAFLVRELNLTTEQANQFFEIYNKMDEDLRAVNERTRALEKKAMDNANDSEADINAALEAVYSQRYQEWAIENEAKAKFEKILTKKQLLQLKRAESRFSRALMREHNNRQRNRQP